MIRLHVGSSSDTAELGAPPAPYFKFEGPLLCKGPQNQMIGCYCDPSWEILGTTTAYLECSDRVIVRFLDWEETASIDCGPFDRLCFSADACYADTLPVARFIDRTNCWQRDSDGSCWPRMLLLSQELA
jgi:hypothetical protein